MIRDPLGPRKSAFRRIMLAIAICGLVLCLLPMAMIVLMSFSGDESMIFPPQHFSTHWYGEAWRTLIADRDDLTSAWQGLKTSLWVALIAMVLTVAVCIPLAYVLERSNSRWKRAIEVLFVMPIVFPLVALGLAFLLMAEHLHRYYGIELGLWRLVIPHATLALPYVLRNCMAAMNGIGTEIEEAAQSLGASPLRAFFDVIVPLMKPGILAGMIFAFIISFNEFTATFFMYTIDVRSLPIWMYSRTVSALEPTTLAISTLIILLDVILIIWMDKLVSPQRK